MVKIRNVWEGISILTEGFGGVDLSLALLRLCKGIAFTAYPLEAENGPYQTPNQPYLENPALKTISNKLQLLTDYPGPETKGLHQRNTESH